MDEFVWERKMLNLVPRVYKDVEFYEVLDNKKELLDHSLGIIISFVATHYGYYYDLDELYGIGVDALLEVVYDYSVSNGSYTEYLKTIIKQYIDSYLLEEEKKESIDEIYDKSEETGQVDDQYLTDDEEQIEQVMLNIQVNDAISTLTKNEQIIIKGFYGIDGPKKSLKEMSKELGLSYDIVRMHRDRAEHKLRHPRVARKLKDFDHIIKVYKLGGKHE